MINIENTLEVFKSKLPSKPYYTNDYTKGKWFAEKDIAISASHIQPNSKTHKFFIIIDVDSSTATMDWDTNGLPAPHLVTKNRENGHAHYAYMLEKSVRGGDFSSKSALKFLSDVQQGLVIRAKGDSGYNGVMTKNPFSKDWDTFSFQTDPYDLGYLSEFVDKEAVKLHKIRLAEKKLRQGYSTGRNCSLFEDLRVWGYKNFSKYNDLRFALQTKAEFLNNFELPLDWKELNQIVDSVYKFIDLNFSIEQLNHLKSQRARKSGLKGGRPVKFDGETKPWEDQGISKSTYYSRLKSGILVPEKTITELKPWEKEGISRATWYRNNK